MWVVHAHADNSESCSMILSFEDVDHRISCVDRHNK